MRARRPPAWQMLAAGLIVASLVRIGRVLHDVSSRHINEDQATVLLAAQELIRGQLHQPTFPGQDYGVFYEALPAAAGQLLGLAPLVGLTTTMLLLWYSSWLAVAAAAWSWGARAVAVLAAAAPLLLAVYPLYYASLFTTGLGRFLAVLGAVLLVRRSLLPVAVGASLLAVLFDPSSVLLPVVGTALAGTALIGALRKQWLAVAVACQPALLWAAWRHAFSARHPDHGLHAAPSLDVSWSGLQQVLGRAPDYAEAFSLALLPGGVAALAVGAAVIALALWRGGTAIRVAAVSVVLVTALIAATPRALDDVSIFLPGSRLFLSLPFALALVAARVEAGRSGSSLVAPAIAVVVLSAVLAPLRWAEQVDSVLVAAATAPVVPLVPQEELDRRCRAVAALDADLVVYLADRAAAYGCPALLPDSQPTLLPAYERRTWRLYEEHERVRRRIAVVGDSQLCSKAAAVGLACHVVSADPPAVVIQPGPRTALEVLRQLGVAVRPFGPGCRPAEPQTCPA